MRNLILAGFGDSFPAHVASLGLGYSSGSEATSTTPATQATMRIHEGSIDVYDLPDLAKSTVPLVIYLDSSTIIPSTRHTRVERVVRLVNKATTSALSVTASERLFAALWNG